MLARFRQSALLSQSEVIHMSETAKVEQEQVSSPSKDAKQGRELSTIDFPYNSLEDVIPVAKAVHKLGGNECRIETLAGELGHESIKSGGFRQKIASAQDFGLTSYSSGMVRLTSLGERIVDQDQERAARVEAFLKVPLYAAIYEEFKNGALPPTLGLEAKMVSLGVSVKQKDKARQVFQRSAKEAGFFAYGTTKLIYPAVGKPEVKGTAAQTPDEINKKNGNGGGEGGGGNEPPKYHPFIAGLLDTLPPTGNPKTEWTLQGRQDWLQTAAGIFNLIYKTNVDDKGTVTVSVDVPKTSAN
jgi:hypothetical protein